MKNEFLISKDIIESIDSFTTQEYNVWKIHYTQK